MGKKILKKISFLFVLQRSFQRWKIATREHLTTVPNALHQMIVNRDVNENDYEVLLQLEKYFRMKYLN